jgi:hypothetical protein
LPCKAKDLVILGAFSTIIKFINFVSRTPSEFHFGQPNQPTLAGLINIIFKLQLSISPFSLLNISNNVNCFAFLFSRQSMSLNGTLTRSLSMSDPLMIEGLVIAGVSFILLFFALHLVAAIHSLPQVRTFSDCIS